jgi:hypothetical protein
MFRFRGKAMTGNHRWRRSQLLAFCALAAAVSVGLVHGRSAAAETNFAATASAAGVRFTVTAQNAPLTSTPIDVGGPVAQAQLDSLGTSAAFASFPYPGDVVVSLPGTAAGFTKGAANLPQYPFYVGSSYPLAPKASTARGPYSLEASSQPDGSTANADAGLSGGSVAVTSLSTSASVVHRTDGSVVARALSTTSPFAVGALHLGTVTSEATTTVKPDGSTVRASHLDITSITAAGLSIALTDKGFTILGTTVPVPSLDALNTILAPQHIKVTYVAARPTDHGVISAALQITDVQTFPDVGASSVTYVLGQDAATIQGALVPSAGAPIPVVSGTPVDASAIPPNAIAVPVTPVVPVPAAPTPGEAIFPSRPAHAPVLAARHAAGLAAGHFSLFRFYGILVAAALAASGLALVFGGMGVRSRWTS